MIHEELTGLALVLLGQRLELVHHGEELCRGHLRESRGDRVHAAAAAEAGGAHLLRGERSSGSAHGSIVAHGSGTARARGAIGFLPAALGVVAREVHAKLAAVVIAPVQVALGALRRRQVHELAEPEALQLAGLTVSHQPARDDEGGAREGGRSR